MNLQFLRKAALKRAEKEVRPVQEEQAVERSFIDDAEKAADIVSEGITSGDYIKLNDELAQLVMSDEAEEQYVFPPHSSGRTIVSYVISWLLIAGLLYFALQSVFVVRYSAEFRDHGVWGLLIVLLVLTANLSRLLKRRANRQYAHRYEVYANILKYRKIEIVSDLALVACVKKTVAVKDLKRAVKERLIPEGHFGRNNFIFLTSDELYADYLNRPAVYDRYFQKKLEEREKTRSRSPELEKILSDGRDSVQTIRNCNVQIKDIGITKKLDRLEMLVAAIFHEVETNPAQARKLGLFMSYYLPTTEKLLAAYIDLDKKGEKGPVIAKTQASIADSMDMINAAFEKLLERFYQERHLELSSEITAMETIMKEEGLQQ